MGIAVGMSASLLPNHALVERVFADRLQDLEGAVRNHDRSLVEKMLEEEAHTRRLTMGEHDMLRKKVFAFEDQLASELRREELERERRECDQGLRNVDVCLHDVALERQLIDARNDDNISRRLRQAADIAAVQRIQSDESAAVRRALLYAPPPTIPAIRSLVTERINGRNDVAFEFAQREAALNELAVLHGTSPVKATSSMYGVPLPYEGKLDSFGQARATEQYHDRFRYTNDVMDYLHPRHEARPVDIGTSINSSREAQLMNEIRHLNVAPARRLEAIRNAPVPSARKIDLLHELIAANK